MAGLSLIDLPKLTFTFANDLEEFLSQLDGFLFRIGAKNCEAADQLFGFGERTIGDRETSTGAPHARAESAGQTAFGGDQPAGFETVLDRKSVV